MSTLQPGTIVEFPVPYADGVDASGVTEKLRPILVMTSPDALGDVVVLPITGSGHLPNSEALTSADLSTGKMKKSSFIRVKKPLTVNVARAGRSFGQLKGSSLTRLKSAMCTALGCC